MTCKLDIQPSSQSLDNSSPYPPPFPLLRPIKRDGDFISVAEREVLDVAKTRLVSLLHFVSTENTILLPTNRFYPGIHRLPLMSDLP